MKTLQEWFDYSKAAGFDTVSMHPDTVPGNGVLIHRWSGRVAIFVCDADGAKASSYQFRPDQARAVAAAILAAADMAQESADDAQRKGDDQ